MEETPENTMAAFKRAVNMGARGLMVEIRRTKDNRIVLMHDETIDRTTDGKGYVDQMFYDELRIYDAGLWRGEKFKGERVPLLAEVLNFAKASGLKLVLDVKQFGLEDQVLSLIKDHGMLDNVYFLGALRNISQLEQGLPIHNIIFSQYDDITSDLLSYAHNARNYIAVKMIDSDNREVLKKSISKKADIVVVNYPQLIMDIYNTGELLQVAEDDFSDYFVSHKVNRFDNNPNGTKQNKKNDSTANVAFVREEPRSLPEVIQSESEDDSRMAALSISGLYDEEMFPVLIDLLDSKRSYVRCNAIWALGLAGEKRAVPQIIKMFNDKEPEVRRETLLTLKRLFNLWKLDYDELNQVTDILIGALEKDEDADVRYDAARTLQDLRSERAVPSLIKGVANDRDWRVKSACAGALGKTKDKRGIKHLKNLFIEDTTIEATWARKRAAWALGDIGENAIESLIEGLRDNEESTRRRASWALVGIGKLAVQALVATLKNQNRFARERAAITLGWINDSYATSSLIWRLSDNDSDVRTATAWALGRLGDEKAMEALRSARKDKDIKVRMTIMESINRIKNR